MNTFTIVALAASLVAGNTALSARGTQAGGTAASVNGVSNTRTAHQLIERFVEVYNMEGSLVYPLYADRIDWIEMPSGRRGGHDELFAALKGARTAMTNLRLTVLSITADQNSGVLESELHAVRTNSNAPIVIRVLWFFAFDNDKIVKEHDYSVTPVAPKP